MRCGCVATDRYQLFLWPAVVPGPDVVLGCIVTCPRLPLIDTLRFSWVLLVFVFHVSLHLHVKNKHFVTFFTLYFLLLGMNSVVSFDVSWVFVCKLASRIFAHKYFTCVCYHMGDKFCLSFEFPATASLVTFPGACFFVFLHVSH